MSPILVRPVREQLEHDRIIRLLQTRGRRRYEVGINPGNEQNVPLGSGASTVYPDVVLASPERGRRVQAIVEVETTESVNHLEALAQWATLARLRTPLHIYVPAGSVDVARRLCADHGISVAEIWSYHTVGDQVRFTMVYRAPAQSRPAGRAPAPAPRRKAAARGPAKAAKRRRAEKRAARRASAPQRRK